MNRFSRDAPGGGAGQPAQMRRHARVDCQVISALTVVDILAWFFIFSSNSFLIMVGVLLHLGVITWLFVIVSRSVGTDRDVKYVGMTLILG
ncbi:MAG: hypothetical protein ACR2OX_08070, partial [Methyloligellaceae bacterium]